MQSSGLTALQVGAVHIARNALPQLQVANASSATWPCLVGSEQVADRPRDDGTCVSSGLYIKLGSGSPGEQ